MSRIQPTLLCHHGGADVLPPRLPGFLALAKSIVGGDGELGSLKGAGEWAGGGVYPGALSEHPACRLSWETGMSQGRCSSYRGGTWDTLAGGGGGRNMHPWVLTHSLVVLVALHVEFLEDDVGQPWHVAVHGLEAQ